MCLKPSAPAGDLRLYQGPTWVFRPRAATYVRMLERADEGVGQILAMLERRGLTSNTMVIFTNEQRRSMALSQCSSQGQGRARFGKAVYEFR